MKKGMLIALCMVLFSTMVLADAGITPRELEKANRERFLYGLQQYPQQPVTIMDYKFRPNNAQMMKERFLRPNIPVPQSALRVQASRPGGWNKGKVFLSPYWKKSVAWAQESK